MRSDIYELWLSHSLAVDVDVSYLKSCPIPYCILTGLYEEPRTTSEYELSPRTHVDSLRESCIPLIYARKALNSSASISELLLRSMLQAGIFENALVKQAC